MTSILAKRYFFLYFILSLITLATLSLSVTSSSVESWKSQPDAGLINNLNDNFDSQNRSQPEENERLARTKRYSSSRAFNNMGFQHQTRFLYHKLTGKCLTITERGLVTLKEGKQHESQLLFLTRIPRTEAEMSLVNPKIVLRIYSPVSKLFLALRKHGKVYGTPNPKDKNTKFTHEYFPASHDSYRSFQHGNFLALTALGVRPGHQVYSSHQRSTMFLVLSSFNNVSPGHQILAFFPSLRGPDYERCNILKGPRLERCRKAALRAQNPKTHRHHRKHHSHRKF